MHATSQSAVWIKEPSMEAGVVIVTSAALPKYMIDKLHVAIDDWDQVAYLAVTQSRALMLDWLRLGSSLGQSCEASQLLHAVSKSSLLLDIEVDSMPGLTWLGSVCGHPLRVVELGTVAASDAAMDRQVDAIITATRSLAKSVLQDRYVI
ncbi:transketolase [Pseudomonas migulae]|uniref:transketolase n=1 Tax=Pseudomonas migulae TaxID=78543 RepID=UPI003721F87D